MCSSDLKKSSDIRQEVPIPMVTLVATAVSHWIFLAMYSAHWNHKLYAALYEWRTGDNKLQNSQPMPTWMYTTAMSIPWNTFRTITSCRCLSPHDGWHLYQSKVRSKVICYCCPNLVVIEAYPLGMTQTQSFQLPILILTTLMWLMANVFIKVSTPFKLESL